jgi:hypothetical protein
MAEAVRVTVTDAKTHEVLGSQIVEAGNYVLLCVPPCRLDSEQHHANGTSVLTVKGRRSDLLATVVTGA